MATGGDRSPCALRLNPTGRKKPFTRHASTGEGAGPGPTSHLGLSLSRILCRTPGVRAPLRPNEPRCPAENMGKDQPLGREGVKKSRCRGGPCGRPGATTRVAPTAPRQSAIFSHLQRAAAEDTSDLINKEIRFYLLRTAYCLLLTERSSYDEAT
jgi:hypothetical protein